MKKFLTKTMVAALLFVSVLTAGCSFNNDISAKKALGICNGYLNNIATFIETIEADGYTYPLETAQAVKVEVQDSDKSHIGVPYSEYLDFNFKTSARKESGDSAGNTLFAPKTLYKMSADVMYLFKDYVDCLTEDNFEFDTTYSYYKAPYSRYEYFKMSVEDDTIYIHIRIANNHTQYVIETNRGNWVSVDRRSITLDDSGKATSYNYFYLKKATQEGRLFDRHSVITWTIESTQDKRDQIRTYDLDETAQKMVFADNAFNPATVGGISKALRDFMLTLNFSDFVNAVDVANAVVLNSPEQ